MGSLDRERPPEETRVRSEEKGACLTQVIDRLGQMFSRRACPQNENESSERVMRQLVIECEPLKQGDGEEQTNAVFREIEEQPYRQNQCSPWSRSNKGLIVALVIFFLSLGINYIMWLTNAYDNAVLKLVSIRDDIDSVFEMWKMPPTKAHFAVYLFNYTNAKAIIDGTEIPNVQEVGPFVFREQMERINVQFYDNDTVSFQEQRSISYVPEMSPIPLNATIYTPNVVFIVAMKKLKDSIHYFEQLILDKIRAPGEAEAFRHITVDQALWGYNDPLITKMTALKGENPQFGFIAKRKGVHHDVITMKTGGDDLTSVGVITKWNGKDTIGAWGNTTCDEFEGSDGTQFPAKFVKEKRKVFIYNHSMCRRIPLVFNKATDSKDGFPVYEYGVFEDMFDSKREENQCFVKEGVHSPDGVANTSPCYAGAPMYASFPHFWKASDEVKDEITGLNPDPEKHRSYFLIHKNLGIPLLAKTRFQLNILLEKFNYMAFSKNMKADKILLPVGWLDYDSGDLPPHFVNSIYHLTYTVETVKEILKWTFLIVFIGSIGTLCYLRASRLKRHILM